MRGHKFSRAEKLLFLIPVLLLLVGLKLQVAQHGKTFRADVLWAQLPQFRISSRGRGGFIACPSNLKQMSLAMRQYTQDYDEKLPLAVLGGASFGWADALQPYLRSTQVYQCPAEKSAPNAIPNLTGYTDYWLNANLQGLSQRRIIFPGTTVLFGEGNDGRELTDATYSKSSLPLSWIKDKNAPSQRHLTNEVWASGIACYVFADGHAKILAPDKVTTFGGRKDSFAVR